MDYLHNMVCYVAWENEPSGLDWAKRAHAYGVYIPTPKYCMSLQGVYRCRQTSTVPFYTNLFRAQTTAWALKICACALSPIATCVLDHISLESCEKAPSTDFTSSRLQRCGHFCSNSCTSKKASVRQGSLRYTKSCHTPACVQHRVQ
jgi:hypothetical protein